MCVTTTIGGAPEKRCPLCGVTYTTPACPVCVPSSLPEGRKPAKSSLPKGSPAVKLEYIVRSHVVKVCKANGRRVGADFLLALDEFVRRKVGAACRVHNGSKKTLDSAVAGMVGLVSDRKGTR